jgi:hypothetical protein
MARIHPLGRAVAVSGLRLLPAVSPLRKEFSSVAFRGPALAAASSSATSKTQKLQQDLPALRLPID